MKSLILTLVLISAPASANSPIIHFNEDEIEAADFLAQCAHEIAGKSFHVIGGQRSYFEDGAYYTFNLKSPNGHEVALEVWRNENGTIECELKNKTE